MAGQKELVLSQVCTLMEMFPRIKCVTSETDVKNNILVRHLLLEIHDLGK